MTGHHGYYASCLIEYLLSHEYETTFVTLKDNKNVDIFRKYKNLNIIFTANSPDEELEKGFLKRTKQILKALRECYKLIDDKEETILHILYFDHNILPFYISKSLKTNRFQYNVVGTLFWPYFVQRYRSNNFIKKIYHLSNSYMLKRLLKKNILKMLFVHTDFIKNQIVKEMGKNNFIENKTSVVPDPVLKFHAICSKDEARKKLNLPANKTIILFFGVLSHEKGLDILLQAVKNIKRDFILLIAGRPVYLNESYIQDYKNQLDDPSRIEARIQHIPEEDVPFYFLSADAAVLPYRKTFIGTSGVLQQACGAGKPLIATDVGEVGRTVRKYNLGIVVEPESVDFLVKGIEKFLISIDKLTTIYSQNALNYAEEHSWIKMAEQVESAYQKILK